MTITFKDESDVIVYALEKLISHARRTQQLFVAQCIWWLASIIGLEQGFINYIDNLRERELQAPIDNRLEAVHPDRIQQIRQERAVSSTPRDLTEDSRLDRILVSAERIGQESSRDRAVVQQGRVNSLPTTKTQLSKARKSKRLQEGKKKQEAERNQRLQKIRATVIRNLSEGTEGIQLSEIRRRRSSGECLRCAWPADRKGAHLVANCRRPIKLDKETANLPKAKGYQKLVELSRQQNLEDDLDQESSSDSSNSDDSL
jgi:hypothetical protein